MVSSVSILGVLNPCQRNTNPVRAQYRPDAHVTPTSRVGQSKVYTSSAADSKTSDRSVQFVIPTSLLLLGSLEMLGSSNWVWCSALACGSASLTTDINIVSQAGTHQVRSVQAVSISLYRI